MKTHLDYLNEIIDVATGQLLSNQCKVCNHYRHCCAEEANTFCYDILKLAANSLEETE